MMYVVYNVGSTRIETGSNGKVLYATEAAAKAAAAKKKTITCTKGKLTKKVTAVKPKCPKGYKKK